MTNTETALANVMMFETITTDEDSIASRYTTPYTIPKQNDEP